MVVRNLNAKGENLGIIENVLWIQLLDTMKLLGKYKDCIAVLDPLWKLWQLEEILPTKADLKLCIMYVPKVTNVCQRF
jgi:hypothetical protein